MTNYKFKMSHYILFKYVIFICFMKKEKRHFLFSSIFPLLLCLVLMLFWLHSHSLLICPHFFFLTLLFMLPLPAFLFIVFIYIFFIQFFIFLSVLGLIYILFLISSVSSHRKFFLLVYQLLYKFLLFFFFRLFTLRDRIFILF